MKYLVPFTLTDNSGNILTQVRGYSYRGCARRALKQAGLKKGHVKVVSVSLVVEKKDAEEV